MTKDEFEKMKKTVMKRIEKGESVPNELKVVLSNGIAVLFSQGNLIIQAPDDRLLKMFIDVKDAVPASDVTVCTVRVLSIGLTSA